MNPYETLGVSKSATLDQIHKAYRAKAKKHHPDSGGDPEEFKKIQRAWEVLSDPKKKEWYDKTDSDVMPNDGEIEMIIENTFTSVLNQLMSNSQYGVLMDDLQEAARKTLKTAITQAEVKLSRFKEQEAKLKKWKNRLRRKNSNEPTAWSKIVEEQIALHEKEIIIATEGIKQLKKAYDELNTYEDAERSATPHRYGMVFGGRNA